MAEGIVQLGTSPEQVAFNLMQFVMRGEGKNVDNWQFADKAYILKTYQDCLRVVRGGDAKE